MKFLKTYIKGVVIIEPAVFSDNRGYFLESFNKKNFEDNIGKIDFVQDNESKSSRGVLRGLHFQKPPFAQAKLVRCIKGSVIDVAVDIRKGSPTYGKHVSIELSEDNKKQLYIPRGFAHGYSVLSESAIFAYKVDSNYAPECDAGILWKDPDLNIQWGVNNDDILISKKDSKLPSFSELESPFTF
jgi:dTDP-4-dehydrorhamnose 3,5-epimerase